MIRCRCCNSDKVYKAGFYTTKKSKERRQMYRCKLCNRRFVLEQKRPKYPDDFKEKYSFNFLGGVDERIH